MARYIKKGTPVGRPKVYLDATERPTRLTASVPVELYTQLAQAAAAQHISLSGLMVQALERYLHTPALSSPSSQTIDSCKSCVTSLAGSRSLTLSQQTPRSTVTRHYAFSLKSGS
jgi:hypothetical protein